MPQVRLTVSDDEPIITRGSEQYLFFLVYQEQGGRFSSQNTFYLRLLWVTAICAQPSVHPHSSFDSLALLPSDVSAAAAAEEVLHAHEVVDASDAKIAEFAALLRY